MRKLVTMTDSTTLANAAAHLIRGIVDKPDDVDVTVTGHGRRETIEVVVHPEDAGRVIGRKGRTAQALRQVIGAMAGHNVRVDIVER